MLLEAAIDEEEEKEGWGGISILSSGYRVICQMGGGPDRDFPTQSYTFW